MNLVEYGSGPPLVLVPGIQGRWEWFRPAVDALAETFRVITFSLDDERVVAANRLGTQTGMDRYVAQIGTALDGCGIARATICGISFGGLAALRFAAQYPTRTTALVLASTPGPSWHLRPSHAFFVRWPRLCAPLFFATAPLRVAAEIAIAIPTRRDRVRFGLKQLALLGLAPLSPTRMAARARLIASANPAAACPAVTAPTLVLSGEAQLDHVVSAEGTHEYAQLIQGARSQTLEKTGHLGYLTRPREFAGAVAEFSRDASRQMRGSRSDAA